MSRQIIARTPKRKVTYKPIEDTEGVLSMVYNVELCATGIEYPLASGPATFTPEDLLEAVASQNDPAIQSPRVWLGHPDDQRFHAGRTSPAGSAEPALGKVVGMRVEDEGQVLVGDIAGCPTWLAKILASAYPSRSIEGSLEATTVTGHTWRLVITDLALLGVTWPGVSTLEDLQALYSLEGPDDIEVEETMPVTAARTHITAQVNIEDVRRAFYNTLNGGDLEISAWSWVRAMQLDPHELIVDDDEGGLYKVPFSVKGEDVEFGEPVQVKVQYVNASQAKDPNARGLLVNMLTRDHEVIASWDQRAESRPDINTQEDPGMTPDQIRLLRARLSLSEEQLPDHATQEQITAALSGEAEPTGEPGQNPGPTPTPPAVPPVTTPAHEPGVVPGQDPGTGTPSPDQVPSEPGPGRLADDRVPVAASALPPGYVAVPQQAWAEVQANAAAGAAAASRSEAQRRQDLVAQAVREGRIAPAQRGTFSTMFERDPQGTETLLTASVEQGGLMPGTIPVEARGSDPDTNLQDQELYPASWLPELQAQRGSDKITVEA